MTEPGLYSDGAGLYLRVSKTGAKSWRFIYTRDKKRTELGLGSAAHVGISDARERVSKGQQLLARNIDPKREWRAEKYLTVDRTFGSVAVELIAGREPGWKNPKSAQQWQNTLQTYASSIWFKDVRDVSVDDVCRILRPIWSQKAETAQRVRGRIETVLDAAKVRGLREGENAARWKGHLELLLPKQKAGPRRHQPAMPFVDVPSFVSHLRTVPGLSSRALELTILTACRTSEVLKAQWSEFDLQAALWTIPAERMKAHKVHRVPLSRDALDLLNSLPRESELVFPGAKRGKPLSNMSLLMCLRRMNLSQFTVHGFRSSFRDWCGEMTLFPREIAEEALAHTVGSEVERAYRRGDSLERRRELMQAWANYLHARSTQDS
jgi:integrase